MTKKASNTTGTTRKKARWVMSPKGGSGKTMFSLAAAGVLESHGKLPRLIDCDAASKLTNFLKKSHDVLTMTISASADAIEADAAALMQHWDRLFEEMDKGDTLIDFGANVDRGVLEWALKSELGDTLDGQGIDLEVYVPVVADAQAIESALGVSRAISHIFPDATLVLVRNLYGGSFSRYDDGRSDDLAEITSLAHYVIEMPKCSSEAWPAMNKAWVSPMAALDMTPAQCKDRFNMSALEANRGLKSIAAWIEAMVHALDPVLFPPKVEDSVATVH